MCCSGKHDHTHGKNSEQENRAGSGFHFPMMMICCLLPIIAIFFLGTTGIGGSLGRLLPLLMIVVCLGSHFFMHGHSHSKTEDCCKDDERENRDKLTD